MKTIVISLGGSLIIPNRVDFAFLDAFKKEIRKYYSFYKFVIVCGGGSVARTYMDALSKEGKNEREIADAGIMATRMNAKFLMEFFGKEANKLPPKNMEDVAANLHKNKAVICGALRYADNETSDGTAAKLANFLNCDFINMTNVRGLYTSDPRKDKKAQLIPKITWKDFELMAHKTKFKAGQHFVLDQTAATIIRNHRIKTYIIGNDVKNLGRVLENKKFAGTFISE